MNFPIFRKLSNNKRFYKINSDDSFDELQVLGNKVFMLTIKAHQYLEKILIQDMINKNQSYVESTLEEFSLIEKSSQNLT